MSPNTPLLQNQPSDQLNTWGSMPVWFINEITLIIIPTD